MSLVGRGTTLYFLTFGSNSNLFAAFSSLLLYLSRPFLPFFPPLKSINKHDG